MDRLRPEVCAIASVLGFLRYIEKFEKRLNMILSPRGRGRLNRIKSFALAWGKSVWIIGY